MDSSETSLTRKYGLGTAVAIIVGQVIAVGIFLTPGDVAKQFPQAASFFFAWLLGGALALAGALANAELEVAEAEDRLR